MKNNIKYNIKYIGTYYGRNNKNYRHIFCTYKDYNVYLLKSKIRKLSNLFVSHLGGRRPDEHYIKKYFYIDEFHNSILIMPEKLSKLLIANKKNITNNYRLDCICLEIKLNHIDLDSM